MDELSSVLVGWLSSYDEWRAVLELRVADLFEPSQYAETHLLGAKQANEGLHRRTAMFSQTDQESVAMRNAAIQEVADSEQLSSWLREKLQYVHEPSLSLRLREVVRALERLGMPLRSKDRRQLVGRVVHLRNELTHRSSDAAHGWTAWELMFLSKLLETMLDVLLFARFGAKRATIATAAEGISGRGILDRIEEFGEDGHSD